METPGPGFLAGVQRGWKFRRAGGDGYWSKQASSIKSFCDTPPFCEHVLTQARMPNVIIQPPVWPPQQQLQQVPPMVTTVQEPWRHRRRYRRYPHHSPRHFHHVPQVQPVRGPDRGNVGRGRHILLQELRVPTRILQQDDDIIALPRIVPQGGLPSIIVP
jgi:hypothetical protein